MTPYFNGLSKVLPDFDFPTEKVKDVAVLDDVYLGWVLDVFPPRPHCHQEVDDKESPHETHHHRVVGERGEKFNSAWDVHQVWHDKERAAEEGQVVAEALSD